MTLIGSFTTLFGVYNGVWNDVNNRYDVDKRGTVHLTRVQTPSIFQPAWGFLSC